MPMSLPSVIQVFMSYSRRDKDVMWRTAIFLRKQGVNVWVDNEKLIPGTPIWEEEIEKAIKAAKAVVVVMSPDSKNSEWVRREISLADQYRKHILPILVRGDEDSSITLRLVTRQYVDMRADEEVGLNSLYSALSAYLGEAGAQKNEIVQPAETLVEESKIENRISSGANPWVLMPGWVFAGALGGFMYDGYGPAIGGAIAGLIAGIIVSIALKTGTAFFNQKTMISITLAWMFSGAVGWFIGEELTEAIGMAIGYAIIPAIGIAITLRLQHAPINWKSMIGVASAWAIGGAIGWLIGRYFQQNDILDSSIGWTIGYAISWAIGGFVLAWRTRGKITDIQHS